MLHHVYNVTKKRLRIRDGIGLSGIFHGVFQALVGWETCGDQVQVAGTNTRSLPMPLRIQQEELIVVGGSTTVY